MANMKESLGNIDIFSICVCSGYYVFSIYLLIITFNDGDVAQSLLFNVIMYLCVISLLYIYIHIATISLNAFFRVAVVAW